MELNELPALYYALHPAIQFLLVLIFSLLCAELIRFLLNTSLRIYKKRTGDEVLVNSTIEHLRPVLKVFLPLIIFNISVDTIVLSPELLRVLHKIAEVLLIGTIAWLFVQVTEVVQDLVYHNYNMEEADNYLARKVQTQVQFIKRLIVVGIFIVAVSIILLNFEGVRNIGAGLLTSAGVTGIIIGFAAQRSIANLIAGFQIAFTQPIRIDDVVIIEGEWGRIEEITFTYVVLRIWDERRLIVPINYFIENTFQNWTRSSADILGTVFLYTDYFVPIEELRKELRRLCEGSPYWDKRVSVVQVTDLTEQSVQIRALMSAASSSNAWELRVMVREKLVEFIRRNYPESLPRTRAELQELPKKMDRPPQGRSGKGNSTGKSDPE